MQGMEARGRGILCRGLGGVVWFFPVMMVRLVWGVGAGGEAEG